MMKLIYPTFFLSFGLNTLSNVSEGSWKVFGTVLRCFWRTLGEVKKSWNEWWNWFTQLFLSFGLNTLSNVSEGSWKVFGTVLRCFWRTLGEVKKSWNEWWNKFSLSSTYGFIFCIYKRKVVNVRIWTINLWIYRH